jgi:membrane-bound ClpP family serine protease
MKFLNRLKQAFFPSVASAPEVLIQSVPDLIGRIGKTLTPLRTSGYMEVDGQRVEVTSSKGYIPKDALVRITGKRMNWYMVERNG